MNVPRVDTTTCDVDVARSTIKIKQEWAGQVGGRVSEVGGTRLALAAA